MNNQVCEKLNTECYCNKWHYILKNNIQILSKNIWNAIQERYILLKKTEC